MDTFHHDIKLKVMYVTIINITAIFIPIFSSIVCMFQRRDFMQKEGHGEKLRSSSSSSSCSGSGRSDIVVIVRDGSSNGSGSRSGSRSSSGKRWWW